MDYKIVSDSGGDMTPELMKEMNAVSVPLSMTIGTETFIDDESLDVRKFLKKMHEYKGQAKSSCPSPHDFMKECDKGKTNSIVTLSSKLSGSYDSANLAKNMLAEKGIDVCVFDSKTASAGQLLIILKLHELIKKGLEKLEIISKIEEYIKRMKTYFVLENLENLVKNGRMSKLTGLLAGFLHLYPILGADQNGEIALYSKVRGAKNSINKLADTIGEMCRDTKDRILSITHCNAIEKVETIKSIVEEKYDFKKIVVAPTRGLAGMYANEGGVIIAF